jgi:competence protein ComEC
MALGLALGIRMAAWPQEPGAGALLAALLAVTAAVWMLARLPWRDRAVLLLLCMALGCAEWALRAPPQDGDALFRRALDRPNQVAQLEGRISETPVFVPGMERLRFVLDVSALIEGKESISYSGRCLVYWSKPTAPLFDGERVRVSGKLRSDISSVNFGMTCLEDRCRQAAIFTRIAVNPDGLVRVGVEHGSWQYWISRLRQAQADLLRAAVPADAVPFVLGVWLGERGEFDGELYDQFVVSGTVHVLSVGGMHVGLIYISFPIVLGMFIRSRRLRAVFAMLGVVVFSLAAGAQPPTLRAMWMVAAVLAYEMFDREPDTLTALGLSGFFMLAFDPSSLLDLGFILSYLSMGSLLLFQLPVAGMLLRLPRAAREGLAATVGAQLLCGPVAAWSFYILPAAGLVANLVVVPLLGIVLYLTFATVITAALWPTAALLPGHALWFAVWLTERTVAFGASLPASHFIVPRPTALGLALWFIAMYMVYRRITAPVPGTRRQWITVGAVTLLAVLCWPRWTQQTRIDFLDVGHADAACVVTPAGAVVLIDGGDLQQGFDHGKMTIAPYLRAHGIVRVGAVIATHPDSDHMGGLLYIVEHFPVGAAWLAPAGKQTGELETRFLEACQRRGVPVRRVSAGDEIPLPGGPMQVLGPHVGGLSGGGENDQSLVLRLGWGDQRVLFAGDIEAAAEKALSAGDCRADLLKVPHHGSATSSSAAFLDAVRPSAVVVSTRDAGRLMALGRGVAERYAARGLHLWRTDQHGGIRVLADGGRLTLSGARDGRGYTLERGPNTEK